MINVTTTQRESRNGRPALTCGNERGMALILTLVMLALLSILGVWALDTSTTDLKIAGNFRTTQNAFYAADGGVGYATNVNTLVAVINHGPGWSSNRVYLNSGGSTTASFTASAPSLIQGATPQSGGPANINDSDESASGWHAIYTSVTSTGTSANNSLVVVESLVSKKVPNVGY